MNQKQKKFCEHYVETGNATESAKEAGYSNKTAYSIGQRLLKKVEIEKYIKELNDKISDNKIASAAEIQQFLTRQLRGEAEEECVTTVSIGDYCTEATIVKKQITPKDRQKAAETLAKIKRLFTDGSNVTVNTPQISDDI